MQPNKQEFSNDLLHVVKEICQVAFNPPPKLEAQRVFGLTDEQLQEIISKIAASLPDSFFEHPQQQLEELKNICAREFVFFQVQERCDDPSYQEHLMMFIHIFLRDMQHRIDSYAKFQTTQREGQNND